MQQLELFDNEKENFDIEEIENFIFELEAQIQKLEDQELFYQQNNAFDWASEFPQLSDNVGNFVGFDAVIGNPPYISYYSNSGEKLNENSKNYYFQNYKSVSKINSRLNTMNLFVELATKIIKNNGLIAFILNKTFTVLPSYINVRQFVLENTQIDYFITDLHPFEAVVDCCIIGLIKNNAENYNFKYIDNDSKNEKFVNIDLFKNNKNYSFHYVEEQNIIEKINLFKNYLSDFVEINRGVNIGGCFDNFLNTTQINQNYYKYLSGTKCIKPYIYTWNLEDGYIIFDTKLETELRKLGKTLALGKGERFLNDKLFIPESSQQLMSAFCDEIIYSAYGIMVASAKNDKMNLKIILALLNSKLLRYYAVETELLRKGDKATPHIGVKGLKSIPIAEIEINEQNEILNLVDKILISKQKNEDSTIFENKIDGIIYKSYNLTSEEIKTIENDSTLIF